MQNNPAFRALFTLPPVQTSASTALSIPEMPAPANETGDREVDAVLWLQSVVRTGHRAHIEMAMEAAKRIKTPMKDLGMRYANFLMRQHGNSFMAALGSAGFGELEKAAETAIERKQKQHDALSRFGSIEVLFGETAAETACKKALRGLKRDKADFFRYDDKQAEERFTRKPDLAPQTLADCLHEQAYWRELYWLRAPFDGYFGDAHPAGQAHDDYCFAMLAKIAPRTKAEALAVFDYMEEHDATDRAEGPAIIRNLISGGWPAD